MNNPLNYTDPTGMSAQETKKSDPCPEGAVCDENGNITIGLAGTVTVTAPPATAPPPTTIPGNTPIIETPWWLIRLGRAVRTGAEFTGKGIVRLGGAALFILTNPTSTGCGASPGMISDGDGGCVRGPKMNTEPDESTEPSDDNRKENPTEEQTPSGTKKKKDKKKEKEKKKERDWTKLSDGEIEKLKDAQIDPHDLKPQKGGSKFDLYKNGNGDIFVRRKKGTGEPDPTGLNINDY